MSVKRFLPHVSTNEAEEELEFIDWLYVNSLENSFAERIGDAQVLQIQGTTGNRTQDQEHEGDEWFSTVCWYENILILVFIKIYVTKLDDYTSVLIHVFYIHVPNAESVDMLSTIAFLLYLNQTARM